MAPNNFNSSEIEVFHSRREDGHDVCYTFSLYNAAAISREYTFTQNYLTTCSIKTSWKFTMTLRTNPRSDVVSGDAKLERLENINFRNVPDPTVSIPVHAHLNLAFRQTGSDLNFLLDDEDDRKFLPGTTKYVYIDTIAMKECKDMLHGEILVALNIFVRNCHRSTMMGSLKTRRKRRGREKGVVRKL